ncbi:hypothetical protein [Verminephrobacter aporrectodeae]|nr:hypothetical protein [Verminephrobacter aporrectodeae]
MASINTFTIVGNVTIDECTDEKNSVEEWMTDNKPPVNAHSPSVH